MSGIVLLVLIGLGVAWLWTKGRKKMKLPVTGKHWVWIVIIVVVALALEMLGSFLQLACYTFAAIALYGAIRALWPAQGAPARRRVGIAALIALSLGLVVLVVGQGFSSIGAVHALEDVALGVIVAAVLMGAVAFVAVRMAGWRDPESETEFEDILALPPRPHEEFGTDEMQSRLADLVTRYCQPFAKVGRAIWNH